MAFVVVAVVSLFRIHPLRLLPLLLLVKLKKTGLLEVKHAVLQLQKHLHLQKCERAENMALATTRVDKIVAECLDQKEPSKGEERALE